MGRRKGYPNTALFLLTLSLHSSCYTPTIIPPNTRLEDRIKQRPDQSAFPVLSFYRRGFLEETLSANRAAILKDDEFILPAAVLQGFEEITAKKDPQFTKGFRRTASYIKQSVKPGSARVKTTFKEKLRPYNFSDASLNECWRLFHTPGAILISERMVIENDEIFEQSLYHERLHRTFDCLTQEEKEYLDTAYPNLAEMINLNRLNELEGIQKIEPYKNMDRLQMISCMLHRTEFYENLACGEFGPYAKKIVGRMRMKFPMAYHIYATAVTQTERPRISPN